jgi:hypothetical protein
MYLHENILTLINIIDEFILRLQINHTIMEAVAEIVKITIPSLIVFFTAFFLLKNMIRNDQDKRRQEILLQNARTVTPIKLQAYERMVLYLERISLESLLVRVSTPEMSASELQSAMLTAIRSEFEHNLSQQIYISPQAWEVVKNARSNTIKMINNEADKVKESAPSIEFSRQLLSAIMGMDKEPTRVAIDFIKAEVAAII